MLTTILIMMLLLSLPSCLLSILSLKDRYKRATDLEEKRKEFEKAIGEHLERD